MSTTPILIPLDINYLRPLYIGGDTTLTTQPPRASASVIRNRRRCLFGSRLPTSSAGNDFVDLYTEDGKGLTISSRAELRRVTGQPETWILGIGATITYPQTIELNEPWCIGAPGQQRDIHFAVGLLAQLLPGIDTARLHPGPDEMHLCQFSELCRRGTTEYRAAFAADRAAREMCTVPIFKNPKLFMIPIKEEQPEEDGWIIQKWYPWQVCANCLAGRAKARCTQWWDGMLSKTPVTVERIRPDEKSNYDRDFGWFTEKAREDFLGKDLGYYDPWLYRDGTQNDVAEV